MRRLGERAGAADERRRLKEAKRAAEAARVVQQVWARVCEEGPAETRSPSPAAASATGAAKDLANHDHAENDFYDMKSLETALHNVRMKAFLLQQALRVQMRDGENTRAYTCKVGRISYHWLRLGIGT